MNRVALNTPLSGSRSSRRARRTLRIESLEDRQLLSVGNLGLATSGLDDVVARHVFYNDSVYDGREAAANSDDDAAIATNKQALLPGEKATFANYTNYVHGINGVIVDIADLGGAPSTDDFAFRVGNVEDVESWQDAPAPEELSVRLGEGVDGSDRVTITWANGAIKNRWLEVTTQATAATGLADPDVFYFGNAVGETGGSTSNAMVTLTDEIVTRNARTGLLNRAEIDARCDFNRDGLVNVTDRVIVRSNRTNLGSALKLITAPEGDTNTALPSFAAIEDVVVYAGSPLVIPLDGFHPEGQTLTYSVSSTNDSLVAASIPEGNRSMRISVVGFGDMVLELHDNLVPDVTGQIVDYAESGLYDGVIFHRVIDDFMIQSGNPAYTGGTTPPVNFDDQFHVDLQHNGSGVLSMAKAGDDTNSSQFFITEGPTRWLDFNHSIFGQLVEGEAVREAISNVSVNSADDRPLTDVVIESIDVFHDAEDGLLMLKAPEGVTGQASVTVRVTDENLNWYEATFSVTVEADMSNGTPFLEPIPAITTTKDTPITFQLDAIDVEGDEVYFDAITRGEVDYTFEIDNTTGEITVTPPSGFVGTLDMLVGVIAAFGSNSWDTQDITIEVEPPAGGLSLLDAALELEPDWGLLE